MTVEGPLTFQTRGSWFHQNRQFVCNILPKIIVANNVWGGGNGTKLFNARAK